MRNSFIFLLLGINDTAIYFAPEIYKLFKECDL